MDLAVYFLAGVLQDFLFTVNIRAIDDHKVFRAAATSFLTVFVGLIVLYNILSRLNGERSIVAITVYCLGVALGTFLGMKYRSRVKRRVS